MAELLMSFETINTVDRIVFRENIDRNGPGMVIELANKTAFRAAVNRITAQGDEEIVDGSMGRIDDTTNSPIAIFQIEADADSFLASKGAGFRKDLEPDAVDGYGFKVVAE